MPRYFQLFARNREGKLNMKFAAIFGIATMFLLASCGGGQPPEPVRITISPQFSVAIDQGATQQFTATVTGTSNTGVAWSVQEGAVGGSITATGLYTAPAKAGTFHVLATSQADSTKSAAVEVRVNNIAVSVSPNGIGIDQGTTQQFTATITGTVYKGVTWSVQEGPAGGTVTPAGLYTAPAKAGTYYVVATSQADGTKTGTATVQVPEVSLTVSPRSAGVVRMGTLQFSAVVSGSVDKRVNWSVQEGAAGGSITADGIYTAPDAPGTFTVVATSVADPLKSANALVSLVDNGFTLVGETSIPRRFHTATLLANGEVLVTGGYTEVCDPNCRSVWSASAEIFDPVTNQFRATGAMSSPRSMHTATLLSDGKVLVIGGSSGSAYLSTAELYDPATGSFSPAGGLNDPRAEHTATRLADGRVFVAGGPAPGGGSLFTTEIYDPGTRSFTPARGMIERRSAHTASLLPDGKVLLAGGSANWVVSSDSAEIFDPSSGTFAATGNLAEVRQSHTATVLGSGRVLVAGGAKLVDVWDMDYYDDVQVFDPGIGTFGPTATMSIKRFRHTATLLPDGKVLLAGGEGTVTAELFDPVTSSFSLTGSLTKERFGHTATLLKDGRVLIVGGSSDKSAEVY